MILDHQAVLQPSPGPKRHSENDGMFVPFGTTRPVMIDAPGDLIATEEHSLREGDERRHPVRLTDDTPGLALLQTSLEPYVEGAVRLNVRAVTTTIMSYAECMRSRKTNVRGQTLERERFLEGRAGRARARRGAELVS